MYGTLPPEERSAAQFMTPLRVHQPQAAAASSAAAAAAVSADVKAAQLKLESPIAEQRPPFAHRSTFGLLSPRPRTMRTASQAELDDEVQAAEQQQNSPPKKPRVSLASLLPQYVSIDEIKQLDADEAAAGEEVERHEMETDEWEIVHETKNQAAAMQLVADLDEAAARLNNSSPQPLIDRQRATRNACKEAVQGVIRRVLSGTRIR
jgi:hypothetical protein